MEQELILWFWRGLLTLGMGGLVRLLIWQRKMERQLVDQQAKVSGLAGLSEQVKENATAVTKLAAAMEGLPGIKAELSACHNRINDVANTTAALTGEMKQINNTLHLIQEHLMAQNK